MISRGFRSKVITAIQPTLQKVAESAQSRLFVAIEKSKCDSTTSLEIQSVQDMNTKVSVILVDKPEFAENELLLGLPENTVQSISVILLILFEVPCPVLTRILHEAKRLRVSVCSLQESEFLFNGSLLININPPEFIVKILEEDSMWFLWGIRFVTLDLT